MPDASWTAIVRELAEVLLAPQSADERRIAIEAMMEPVAKRARAEGIPAGNLVAAVSTAWDEVVVPVLNLPSEQAEWMRWHALGVLLKAYRIDQGMY
jgi:hypothetical protein